MPRTSAIILSLGLLWTAPQAFAQISNVLTLADSLTGAVGGIAVDRMGVVYSADFGTVHPFVDGDLFRERASDG